MTRKSGAIAIIMALSAIVSAPAFAQEVTMTLTGEVEGVCGVFDEDSSPVEIDFGLLSDIEVGQQTPEVTNGITLICNDPDGGIFTIASENGGNLWREGTSGGFGNEVGYTVAATGSNGIDVQPTDLASPVSRNFLGSPDLVNGQPITISFRANGVSRDAPAGNDAPSTTVFAGVYSDIVRVSVTAN